MRSIQILLASLIALTALLVLPGCTGDQIARADTFAQASHTALQVAQDNVAALEEQLVAAQTAAAASGDARIVAVVEQLQKTVAVAKGYLPMLANTAAAADQALANLKASGDATIPWWQVALGIAVPVLLPLAKGIPVVGPMVGQLGEIAWAYYSTHQQKNEQIAIEAKSAALEQTVAGVEAAKAIMSPDQVAKLHLELGKAQDADVKKTVALVKAEAA